MSFPGFLKPPDSQTEDLGRLTELLIWIVCGSRKARLVSLLACHSQNFVGALAIRIDADAL
jgi:hypothetical protein